MTEKTLTEMVDALIDAEMHTEEVPIKGSTRTELLKLADAAWKKGAREALDTLHKEATALAETNRLVSLAAINHRELYR